MRRISHITGRALPMRGNDIDTDRIIPARFLRSVTFDGMEQHVFEDDRKSAGGPYNRHPFDVKHFQGAAVLLVNSNFGCGSSREHAPESLKQWGIKAIVGASFGEIFFGNCTMLGVPCIRIDNEDVLWLQRAVGRDPKQPVTVDVEKQEVRVGERVIKGAIPDGARNQLVSGAWNPTGVLLEAGDAIEATAKRLPYVSGF